MVRRVVGLSLVLVILLSLITGCSGSQKPADSAKPGTADKVKVTFWKHNQEPGNSVTRRLIAEYVKEHPNVEVTIDDSIPLSDYNSKLLVALSGGNGPDIFDLFDPSFPMFIQKGVIEPLDAKNLGFGSMDEVQKAYIPNALKPFEGSDGKVYALPIETNGWSMYINTRHFKEAGLDPVKDAPKTWADMAKVAQRLTKVENGKMVRAGFTWPLKLESGWYLLTFGPVLYGNGASILSNDDKGNEAAINSPKAVEALQIWYDMIYTQKTATPDFGTYTSNNPNVDFAEERLSMWMAGPWAVATLKGTPVEKNFAVIPVPSVNGKNRSVATNAWGWVVNSKADPKVKAEAWKLMAYLASKPEVWLKDAGYLQPRTSLMQSQVAKEFPYLDVFLDDMSHGRPRLRHVQYGEITASVVRALQNTMLKNVPPKQSLDAAADEINKILKSK